MEPNAEDYSLSRSSASRLLPNERLSFNLRGFVLRKRVFTPEECEFLRDLAHGMMRESNHARFESEKESVLFGPAWQDHRVLALAMDARVRAAAEDLVGGETWLEENQFLISHEMAKGSIEADGQTAAFRWHRGLSPAWGSFATQRNYHSLFSKALIYLTPAGPLTGTWVIPGSHRLEIGNVEFASLVDESMMQYVDAQAGDVLLFSETLIHSSPPVRSERERVILVFGYSAPFMRAWSKESEPPAEHRLAYRPTPFERRFIYGEARYAFRVEE
jgi:hypothetical protein